MKKLILMGTVLAVAGMNVQSARAGDREWATVGKVLTGVAIGAAVVSALEAPAHASVTYVYSTPVVRPAPMICAPAPVICTPAPVVYARPMVIVRPAPVVIHRTVHVASRHVIHKRVAHRGQHHGHHRGGHRDNGHHRW